METAALMRQLVDGLRAMTQQQPGQSAEQTVSQARTQLGERLLKARSNDWSPVWRSAVQELGVENLFGNELRAQVEEVLDRNEITPSAAADELEPIADRLSRLGDALNNLLDSLRFFRIRAEELEPGEFEVGF